MYGLVLVLVLSGCGAEVRGGDVAAGSVSPTPTLTGACPVVPGEAPPQDCVPYDGEAAMRGNDAYRQRADLGPERTAAGAVDVARITELLEQAAADGPLDGEAVVALLAAEGYPAVQSFGSSDVGGGVAVGVSTEHGCVVGGVRGAEADLELAGGIADGGCLPAPGH